MTAYNNILSPLVSGHDVVLSISSFVHWCQIRPWEGQWTSLNYRRKLYQLLLLLRAVYEFSYLHTYLTQMRAMVSKSRRMEQRPLWWWTKKGRGQAIDLSQFFGHPFVNSSPYAMELLSVLSVYLSVCNVGVMRPKASIYQDATWYRCRPRPRPQCVRWGHSSPPPCERGTAAPHFSADVYCGETVAHLSNCWALVCISFSLALALWYC